MTAACDHACGFAHEDCTAWLQHTGRCMCEEERQHPEWAPAQCADSQRRLLEAERRAWYATLPPCAWPEEWCGALAPEQVAGEGHHCQATAAERAECRVRHGGSGAQLGLDL